MNWPIVPVERVRPCRFRPRFCPWPSCPSHLTTTARFHRHGFYLRPSDRRRIPRYLCLTCGRTCSRQTFSFTYYLKRRDLPALVASALVACSAHRQIARTVACAKTSVTRLSQRLGRHALLLLSRAVSRISAIDEPLVHDHFETFVARQDRALGIGTAVGSGSWFVFDVDPAPHRGHGRRPDPPGAVHPVGDRAYIRSIRRTLDRLGAKLPSGRSLQLVVDGRIDYPIAVREHPLGARIALDIHPNPRRGPKGSPRTAEARVRDRAMFPVDQLHQLLRHSCSDHKRETISFGRRLESVLGRAFLTAIWKNFVKARSERRPDRRTPAMLLGLATERWSWARVLAKRLFPGREGAPRDWSRAYAFGLTPGLPAHTLRHAW